VNDVLIFVNPIAGRGKGKAIASRISRALSRAGMTPRVMSKAAHQLADTELLGESPATAMISIGGDGTLRGAVERMLAFGGGDPSNVPPVLVVPLGTANLMSRHLGLAWDEPSIGRQVVEAIANRQIMQLDAARANDRLFLLMAGVGIDAAVVHELDRIRNGPIDLTSYALPAVLALHKYDYPSLTVEIDGKIVFNNEPAMAFVGNAPEYGTGFPILSQARSDDGMLDVCVLPCRSHRHIVRLLMAVVAGDHIHQEGVVYAKARSIRITSPQQVPVQIDGDASGHTPLKIDLLPKRLAFIVNRQVGSRL
jgi:diacylglycerol kinase (ATP)